MFTVLLFVGSLVLVLVLFVIYCILLSKIAEVDTDTELEPAKWVTWLPLYQTIKVTADLCNRGYGNGR